LSPRALQPHFSSFFSGSCKVDKERKTKGERKREKKIENRAKRRKRKRYTKEKQNGAFVLC
jgi:hypothetical protein